MELASILLPLLFVTLFVIGVVARRRQARRLKLPPDLAMAEHDDGTTLTLTGDDRGRRVVVTIVRAEIGSDAMTVQIDGLPPALRLGPADDDEPLGDDALDSHFGIGGDRDAALVCLTPYVRDRLGLWRQLDLVLDGGTLTVRQPLDPGSRDEPARTLAWMRLLATQVPPVPDDLDAALRQVALEDPSERWAASAVRALARRLEGTARFDALQRVAGHRRGVASLVAAAALGDATALAAVARDARKAPAARAEALELLAGVAPPDEVASVVRDVLRRIDGTGELLRPLPQRTVALLRTPVGAVMAATREDLVDRLVGGAADAPWLLEPTTRKQVVRAFVAHATPADEDRLVALLPHAAGSARVALAEALGRLGSVKAVPALMALAPGCPEAPHLHAAVTAIQGRVGRGAAGRVSVAGRDASGGLSTVRPGARGGLSEPS